MMLPPDLTSVPINPVADVSLPVLCGLYAKRRTADSTVSSRHHETVSFSANVASAAERGFEAMGIVHTSADLILDIVPLIGEQ